MSQCKIDFQIVQDQGLPEHENKENYDPVACLFTPARNHHARNSHRNPLSDVTKKFVDTKPGNANLLQINATNSSRGAFRLR